MNENHKETKKDIGLPDPVIGELVETAKRIQQNTPEYSHALKVIANRGLGHAGLGDPKEKQKMEMKESIMGQIEKFEEIQEGGGRKLFEILPESLKELITENDLIDLGIK